jgi:hypothetical protein
MVLLRTVREKQKKIAGRDLCLTITNTIIIRILSVADPDPR